MTSVYERLAETRASVLAKLAETTASVLAEMLCENTGRGLCDSGGTPVYDKDGKYLRSEGGYGRAYERNAGRNLAEEPRVTAKFERIPAYRRSNGTVIPERVEVDVRINLYHYLCENLEFHPLWDFLLREFGKTHEVSGDYEEFCAWLVAEGHCVQAQVEFSEYTYNGDNHFSQDFSYAALLVREVGSIYPEEFLVVRTHNGCDARGGFSAPRAFSGDVGYNPTIEFVCEGVDYSKQEVLPEMAEGSRKGHPHVWVQDEPYGEIRLSTDYSVVMGSDVVIKSGDALCPLCGTRLRVDW